MRSAARLVLAGAIAVLIGGGAAGQAAASPGAYRVLVTYSDANNTPPARLRQQIAAESGLGVLDLLDVRTTVPTLAQLRSYDLVVSVNGLGYVDAVGWGNVLADFVDQGGVVVVTGFDSEVDVKPPASDRRPLGRFADAYAPFIGGPFDQPNQLQQLGDHDASSPIMAGVTALASINFMDVTPTGGSAVLAKYTDGHIAAGVRGRVVGLTSYIGDGLSMTSWGGDYGRLIVNAVRVLGRHTLALTKTGTGSGTIASNPSGITCGTTCSADFSYVTDVTLTAAPASGSRLTAWSGACTGAQATCTVRVDRARNVQATFEPIPADTPTPTPTTPSAPQSPIVTDLRATARTIRFSVSQPGSASVTIQRRVAGRRVGSRCRPPTRRNRRRAHCRGLVAAGRATVDVTSGQNQVRLGTLTSRRLANGRYTVRVIATNASGQHSAVQTTSLTLRRR